MIGFSRPWTGVGCTGVHNFTLNDGALCARSFAAAVAKDRSPAGRVVVDL